MSQTNIGNDEWSTVSYGNDNMDFTNIGGCWSSPGSPNNRKKEKAHKGKDIIDRLERPKAAVRAMESLWQDGDRTIQGDPKRKMPDPNGQAILDEMFGGTQRPSIISLLMSEIDKVFKPKAFANAVKQFRDEIGLNLDVPTKAVKDVEEEVINTVNGAAAAILSAVYIPLIIVIVILIWVLVAGCLLTPLVGILLTILVIVIAYFAFVMFRVMLVSFLSKQVDRINKRVNVVVNTVAESAPDAAYNAVDSYVHATE